MTRWVVVLLHLSSQAVPVLLLYSAAAATAAELLHLEEATAEGTEMQQLSTSCRL
jgi:hypothetical protein